MTVDVLVIGAGPAGLRSAAGIAAKGYKTLLLEKSDTLGGHLTKWDRLFPNQTKAEELLSDLVDQLGETLILNNSVAVSIKRDKMGWFTTKLLSGEVVESKSVVIATGFRVFDAIRKEEYGYGIFEGVITNVDLESYFKGGKFGSINNINPSKIGFVHCVGSRDDKVGNPNCSKVCCVSAVKQAIELKEIFPDAEVYCFYMDLRMFGRGFEQIYLDAQSKYGVRFIRGRVSEVSQNSSRVLVVKAEDTLSSRPIKISLDILVLMSGIVPCDENKILLNNSGISISDDGFMMPADSFLNSNRSDIDGIFAAGCIKGPKTVPEVLNEADSVVNHVDRFLREAL